MFSRFLSNLTLKGKVIFFTSILLLSFVLLFVTTMTLRLNSLFQYIAQDSRTDILNQKKVYLHDLVMMGAQLLELNMKNQSKEGSKEKAIKEISKLRFQNDTGYFFAYEKRKVGNEEKYFYVLHGMKEELIGTEVDLSQEYRKEILEKAHEGGGFILYDYEKPMTNEVQKKLSYAYEIPELGWIIGAGIYVDDIEKEILDQALKVKNYRLQLVLSLFIIALVFFLFIFLLGHYVIGYSVEKILNSFFTETKRLIEAAQEGNLTVKANEEKIHFEFRGVLHGMNEVLDSFLRPVKELMRILAKVSKQDLREKMQGEFRGDYLKLQETLNETIESMNQILYQAQLLIVQLSLNATNLAKSSQKLCDSYLDQDKAARSLADNVKKMSVKLEMINNLDHPDKEKLKGLISDQLLFVEEILKSIETIEKTGEKGLLSSEQYSATAEILADQAYELNKIIGSFKLDV